MLCWHAGDCGLISDGAIEMIGRLYFDGSITLPDLRKLASLEVYRLLEIWIDNMIVLYKRVGKAWIR